MDVTSGHVRDDFMAPNYAVCCTKALGLAGVGQEKPSRRIEDNG